MVERQRPGQSVPPKDPDLPRVVPRPGRPATPRDEHRADGVTPGIARRVGVGVELPDQLDGEPRLLVRLPDGGRLERLADLDEAPG